MRLSEFRIKNFRSIVDSGWKKLSSDNITALIGQNESGKTSVLEGLYSFWTGIISEDVLRSDMTFPEISCAYTTNPDETFKFIDYSRMPDGVMQAIKKNNSLVLKRIWLPDMGSRLIISGDEVSGIFDIIDKDDLILKESTLIKIEAFHHEYDQLVKEITIHEKTLVELKEELERTVKRQTELKKLLKRPVVKAEQEKFRKSAESAEMERGEINEKIQQTEILLENKKTELTEKETIRNFADNCLEVLKQLESIEPELYDSYRELTEVEESITGLTGKKELKSARLKLFETKENYIGLGRKMESLREATGVNLRLVTRLIEGRDLYEAEKEARDEFISRNSFYSREEAGDVFFEHIPRYEFFEDFSSLLPNRIDLNDIFENNNKVEGYKAVRNFLMVAGLDPQFFRQINNRILKQKIENLNNEVTVDFQEYWRQNVGKTNKIRINFELEHYDTSHPEKKGKPYLEFWIKDEHERLYPKQRSRGVRWFLSFYLELKAFAKQNENLNRILLIDEPGLSLHARAQEDVLKVFEDIKRTIQIIYTTHSPHLIDHNKLYRLLAIQRARENSEHSETVIFDATHLHSATSDTLSPVSALLGVGMNHQQPGNKKNNVVVEDICSFYYLSAFYKLTREKTKLYFLPANGAAGVTTVVNLLIGWGFDFSVLLFDNINNNNITDELQIQLKGFDHDDSNSRLDLVKNITAPEDIFSALDFKKYVIKKRVGIAESNYAYILDNDISRPVLASGFAQSVASGTLSLDDFDEETCNNLENIFDSLSKRARTG